MSENRIVSAEKQLRARAEEIFKVLADPSRHAQIDGNNNVARAPQGQRIPGTGHTFQTDLTNGKTRENHVVEFEPGRVIAWKPAPVGEEPVGHIWKWELEPIDDEATLVRHTFDWTQLADESRFDRARANTEAALASSIDNLAALSEDGGVGSEAG